MGTDRIRGTRGGAGGSPGGAWGEQHPSRRSSSPSPSPLPAEEVPRTFLEVHLGLRGTRAGWGRADFAVLGGAIGLVVGLAVGVLAPLAAFYLPSAFRTRGRGGGGPGGGPPGPAAARWRGREGRHGPMEPLLEDVASA